MDKYFIEQWNRLLEYKPGSIFEISYSNNTGWIVRIFIYENTSDIEEHPPLSLELQEEDASAAMTKARAFVSDEVMVCEIY